TVCKGWVANSDQENPRPEGPLSLSPTCKGWVENSRILSPEGAALTRIRFRDRIRCRPFLGTTGTLARSSFSCDVPLGSECNGPRFRFENDSRRRLRNPSAMQIRVP